MLRMFVEMIDQSVLEVVDIVSSFFFFLQSGVDCESV